MRSLIAKLVLLTAVLLMPFGMTGASANAAHHGAMAGMPAQHCPQQAPPHDGKYTLSDCTMTCSAALPATAPSHDEMPLTASSPVRPGLQRPMHGLHPDTEIPPPKSS